MNSLDRSFLGKYNINGAWYLFYFFFKIRYLHANLSKYSMYIQLLSLFSYSNTNPNVFSLFSCVCESQFSFSFYPVNRRPLMLDSSRRVPCALFPYRFLSSLANQCLRLKKEKLTSGGRSPSSSPVPVAASPYLSLLRPGPSESAWSPHVWFW
jgi:hypothetical protein